MRWPWSKDVEEALAQAKTAAEDHAHSVNRRIDSELQSSKAVVVTDQLWDELNKNGWTEMLQRAWGGYAR